MSEENWAGDESILFVVTGNRGAGKTTFCQRVAQAAHESGWRTSGLLSLAIFEGEKRTGLDALDLLSRQKRRLAERISPGAGNPAKGPVTLTWQFDQLTLAWGNRVLRASVPTDLLVIDELGPLEWEGTAGWQTGLDVAGGHQYSVALVVVRAEFLPQALLRWPEANLVEIDTPEDSERKAQAIIENLF